MPAVDPVKRAARNVSIGSHLRALREARGLTRDQLGALAGISAGPIQDYEDGTKQLTVARAAELGPIGILAVASYLLAQLPAGEQRELVHVGAGLEPSAAVLQGLIGAIAKLSGAALNSEPDDNLGDVAREAALTAWRIAGGADAAREQRRARIIGPKYTRGLQNVRKLA